VIRLAAFEELSYAEIGEVLGISAGAARSKLYRARKELKEAFEGQTDGGTP
jgi:RNA polymerase sigma factor (sigma-70 family)